MPAKLYIFFIFLFFFIFCVYAIFFNYLFNLMSKFQIFHFGGVLKILGAGSRGSAGSGSPYVDLLAKFSTQKEMKISKLIIKF